MKLKGQVVGLGVLFLTLCDSTALPAQSWWNSFDEHQQKQIFLFLFVFAALKFVTLSVIFYYRQKLNKAKLKAIEQEQSRLALEAKQKVERMTILIEGQEMERERVARELHDSIGNLLASLSFSIQRLPAEVAGVTQLPSYKQVQTLIKELSQELRVIAEQLHPSYLTKYGFFEATKRYVDSFQTQYKIFVQCFFDEQVRFSSREQELMLYRVIQELMSNTAKHAHASRVFLSILFDAISQQLKVTVEDNGVGFDTNQTSTGRGLMNLSARINHLGGQVDISSQMGRGTSVFISLPLDKEAVSVPISAASHA